MVAMDASEDHLALDDAALLAQCDMHIYKASGPGGQHRNKVSSAVRLRHRPTTVSAHGDDSRSQHTNKRLAIRRLRMKIACRIRRPFDPKRDGVPEVVRECIFTPRGSKSGSAGTQRIEVGRRDHRFWRIGAFVLDVLDACDGRLSDAAAHLGVTTSNLVALLQSDRHLLAAAQDLRRNYDLKPLK